MRISGICSSLALGLLVLGAGCGGRGRTPPPSTDLTAPQETEAPAAPVEGTERAGETKGVPLPGQDRFYPSEDPRNQHEAVVEGVPPPAGEPSPETPPPAQPPGGPGETPGSLVFEHAPPSSKGLDPPPVPAGETRYRVQVMATTSLPAAIALREEVGRLGSEPVYVEQEEGIWKVRIGDFRERTRADQLRRKLVGLGYDDAFVVTARGR